MKFFPLSVLSFVASALAVSVSYDPTYDNGGTSLSTVACSDGPHGLMTKGFTTFSSLPDFPFIGGADVVGGWNSAKCGSCWALTYQGTTIQVLVIDHATNGFNIAEEAMNKLTQGQAVFLGRIEAEAVEVAKSNCGL